MAITSRRLGIGWQIGFWVGAFAILIFLLWLVNAVLLPFVVAFALGYVLDPLVNRLESLGLNRAGATTLILVGALVVVVALLVIFAPMLGRQIDGFIKALPDLVQKAQDLAATASDQVSQGRLHTLLTKLGLDDSGLSEIKNSASDFVNRAITWVVGFFNGLLSRSAALLNVVSLILITPVVAFYMLLDWRKMIRSIDGLVPPRDRESVHQLAHDIDRALAGFLRGQSLVCLFLAAWYGIGLSLIGLNFGLLIGLIGGFLSFVPYVGSLVVLFFSLLIAIVQGWPGWQLPAMALGIVLFGQFLEGNVLAPKLVGDKVGLHPVWIIFALLAFGSLWGFTGLIAAVPVASAMGVLLRFATSRYRESAIFTGEVPADPPPILVPAPQSQKVPPQTAPTQIA